MRTLHAALIPVLWALWLVYWWISALRVRPTRQAESFGSRLSHMLPLIVGAVLLASPTLGVPWLNAPIVSDSEAWFWSGVLLVAAGLGFAIWARAWLSGNWSSGVAVKVDHELIRGGPYAVVRHPIYTGLLTAVLGSALTVGEWRGLIGVILIAAGITRRVGLEERVMLDTFGEAYAQYRRDVPAVLPFL
jgi:protein-S-isoprenylcysteine O-methyltransferase Ste14